MNTKIAKEFKWEMSHRLPFHAGPCNNIHGHSYRLWIELEGQIDENKMLLDYYEIAKIINPLIEKLDHSFLCDEKDNLMLDFLKVNNFRYVIIPESSTAENIVKFISDEIKAKFEKFSNLTGLTVRVQETEDTYAEMTFEL